MEKLARTEVPVIFQIRLYNGSTLYLNSKEKRQFNLILESFFTSHLTESLRNDTLSHPCNVFN